MSIDRDKTPALIERLRSITYLGTSDGPMLALIHEAADALESALPAVPLEGDTERTRIEQSNDVADVVFDQVKKAWPDMHPVLDLRYGIADELWKRGYRRSPLPVEGEVEWGVRSRQGYVIPLHSKGSAVASVRDAIRYQEWTVVFRRKAGPWEEVRAFDKGICGACQERPYGHDNFECDGLGHEKVPTE